MSRHTPGPWEIVPLSGIDGPYAIRMTFDGYITFYGVRMIARKGDASLIAAAPELLEAAEQVVAMPDIVGIKRLRLAVAKAKGEEVDE